VELKWPWLVLLLVLLVVTLLAVWLRGWWGRQPAGASYVAHATRLRALPRYRTLVQRRRLLGSFGSLAALVACVGGIVLGGRVQETQVIDRDEATRDIVLCLDASGSSAPWNSEVANEYHTIVDELDGDRVGLTIWNNAAISKVPLTDDYGVVREQLSAAEEAFANYDEYFPSQQFVDFTAGTLVDDGTDQSSLIGDGLVSCVQRFDRLDEDRGRALVLATDGEQRGDGVFDLQEAADYAADAGVVIHVISNPGELDVEGDTAGLQAAADKTGGTLSELGTGGSAEDVVDRINELETTKIERPPLVQTLDRPRAGQVLAGIGVGLLVLVWAAQGWIALAGRRPPP
jgi:hypothetical protein